MLPFRILMVYVAVRCYCVPNDIPVIYNVHYIFPRVYLNIECRVITIINGTYAASISICIDDCTCTTVAIEIYTTLTASLVGSSVNLI
jgi:hypothetical protein